MNQEKDINAQTSRQQWNLERADTWLKSGEWKKGLKPEVHPSVNSREFAYQYHQNKALWNKAFEYFAKTNLDSVSPGKYVLDGENLFVMISEGSLKNFEETRWEAHKKYIDIQYVIQGKEKMGIVPLEKMSVLEIFDQTKDLGFYTADENDAKYYEATQAAFLVFFPGDAHRPSIKIPGFNSDKKIVIKIIAAQ